MQSNLRKIDGALKVKQSNVNPEDKYFDVIKISFMSLIKYSSFTIGSLFYCFVVIFYVVCFFAKNLYRCPLPSPRREKQRGHLCTAVHNNLLAFSSSGIYSERFSLKWAFC